MDGKHGQMTLEATFTFDGEVGGVDNTGLTIEKDSGNTNWISE